ncbi:low temperature requirement protein A [Streptomyces sp. L7]
MLGVRGDRRTRGARAAQRPSAATGLRRQPSPLSASGCSSSSPSARTSSPSAPESPRAPRPGQPDRARPRLPHRLRPGGWLYFHLAASAVAHALRTHPHPAVVVRDVLSYGHLALVAGLLLVSVGAVRTVHDPLRAPHSGAAGLLPVGAALILLTFPLHAPPDVRRRVRPYPLLLRTGAPRPPVPVAAPLVPAPRRAGPHHRAAPAGQRRRALADQYRPRNSAAGAASRQFGATST